MSEPKFEKIRWSHSHGRHFLNEYDPIPYDVPAVIKLEDGELKEGHFIRGGFSVRFSKGIRITIPWLSLCTCSVAVDKFDLLYAEAGEVGEKARKLLRSVKNLEGLGRCSRQNYRRAQRMCEK